MTETTENIRLVKESEDEFYSVHTVNENLDKIDEAFGKKVDKQEGKELSSNDYTDEDKEKLDGIEAGAQVNRVRGVKGSAQETYQEGLVNLTKEDIGLAQVNNTADKDKHVSQAVRLGMPRIAENPSDLSDLSKYPNGSFTVKEFAPVEEVIPELPSGNYYHIYTGQSADPNYASQLAVGMTTGDLAYRFKYAGVWRPWVHLIHSDTIGSQSVLSAVSATDAENAANIIGVYTGSGGAQPPSCLPNGKVCFYMMNAFKGTSGLSGYADCMLMDTYTGVDVPYVTGFAIAKNLGVPRAFIAVGQKGNATKWLSQTELITTGNIGSQSVAYATSAAYDGSGNVIAGTYAKSRIYGDSRVSLGRKSGTTIGVNSFAFGYDVTASGYYSHAEGYYTIASNRGSHAEGYYSTASGDYSHAEGYYSTASDEASHAEGIHTTASGDYSHAEGTHTTASNIASHASGKYNKLMNAGGSLNNQVGDVFVIGNGMSDSAKSNALRVTYKGDVLGTKAFQSSGADYAEFIKPWADGNPEGEDRVGYFVTIKDGFLEKAGERDYIAGITSGNPSVVGNADEDYYWRYERDEFNRIVMEDVPEVVQQTDGNGDPVFDEETHEPVMVETGKMIPNARMKLAEGYDPSMQDSYVPRAERPEWDYVGMVGVIPVRDDGTCVPGRLCRCGSGGVATIAEERAFETYMVLDRISESVVSVILK